VAETTIRFKEADLRIYLLGLSRAECLGGALAVPRRQVRALLFRLAARLQPISREHLCFLFWPDLPESTARRNLSRLLPQLRSALRVPQMLVIAGDQVWLDPAHVWSDTATFERLCAEPDPQHRIDAFAQAIDLYRGPFLDAFSLPGSPEFETWVSLEREGWQQLYLKLLAFLVEKHVAREGYAAAITYARRYLETDDLAEDIHRHLIELYAAVGDRSAELRQYERLLAGWSGRLDVLPRLSAICPEVTRVHRVLAGAAPSPWVRWCHQRQEQAHLVSLDPAEVENIVDQISQIPDVPVDCCQVGQQRHAIPIHTDSPGREDKRTQCGP
jgi:DNA-binding SARP family transcriptional activator